MWDIITYPFPNLNGAAFKIWEWLEWLIHFILHFIGHVITYMLGLKLANVSKMGLNPRQFEVKKNQQKLHRNGRELTSWDNRASASL